MILLTACPLGRNTKYQYTTAYFPKTATNLDYANTEYDDYNSVLPETHYGKLLIFSTNRESGGNEFNLISKNFHASWYWETGLLVVDDTYFWQNVAYLNKMLEKIDREGNQFGPYYISADTIINDTSYLANTLIYSSETDSGYNSLYINSLYSEVNNSNVVDEPKKINFLATSEDQRYVSFYGDNVIMIDNYFVNPNEFSKVYFDEIVNGQHDIMSINIPDSLSFYQFLESDYDYEKQSTEVLNSEFDDRCPFVNGNFMVFTSNRPGGYGGYDLYYSFYENGQWREPINFGPQVNSEADEFRPVPMQSWDFANDCMIFSSNRDGGQGGFDLYYVGIDKITPIVYN